MMQERARYQTHNNSLDCPGYVKFLKPALSSVMGQVAVGSRGLDFGCGPGPTLSVLLRREGYPCEDYDPLFYNNPELLSRTYDFVTCTEVVEHFYFPRTDLQKLEGLLDPGGVLVIMTDHRSEERDFENWGYRTDSTHVCFYSEKTWDWFSRWTNLELVAFEGRIVVFKKPELSVSAAHERVSGNSESKAKIISL